MNCAARRCTIALVPRHGHPRLLLGPGNLKVLPSLAWNFQTSMASMGNMTIMLKLRVIPDSDVSNTQSRRGETL
jgi:hypothetical protein